MANWKKVVLATGTSSQYIKGDGTFATYSTGLPLTGGTLAGTLTIDSGGTSRITIDGNNTSGDDGNLQLYGHTSSSSRAYISINNGVTSGGQNWYVGALRGDNSFAVGRDNDFGTDTDFSINSSGNATFGGDVNIKSTGGNDDPATLALWSTDTSIADNDTIGTILAQGSDSGGSPPYLGGKIEFNADANWDTGTTGYYPTRIDFFTESNSGTVSTANPALTLDSSQNATFAGAINSSMSSASVLGNLRNTHASGYGLKIQATDANSARYIATFNDKDDNMKARIYGDGSATFSGDVTIGSNDLIFESGEKVFSTSGYVVADGDAGFIARDSGVNKLIINGDTATFAGQITVDGGLVKIEKSTTNTGLPSTSATDAKYRLLLRNPQLTNNAEYGIGFSSYGGGVVASISSNTYYNGEYESQLRFQTRDDGDGGLRVVLTLNKDKTAVFANSVDTGSWLKINGNNTVWSATNTGTYIQAPATTQTINFRSNGLAIGAVYDAVNKRLGVGSSTSPSYALDVTGPATENGSTLRLNDVVSSKNSKHLLIQRSSSTASIGIAGSQANDPLWISRSGGYDLMATSAGNIGIGEATPSYKLDVVGAYSTQSLSAGATAVMGISAAASGSELVIGGEQSGGKVWIQNRHKSVNGYAYELAIQPQGGTTSFGSGSTTFAGEVGIARTFTLGSGSKIEYHGEYYGTFASGAKYMRVGTMTATGTYSSGTIKGTVTSNRKYKIETTYEFELRWNIAAAGTNGYHFKYDSSSGNTNLYAYLTKNDNTGLTIDIYVYGTQPYEFISADVVSMGYVPSVWSMPTNDGELETSPTGSQITPTRLFSYNTSGTVAFKVDGGFEVSGASDVTGLTSQDHIRIPVDSKALTLGASHDIQIYHNGSHSYFENANVGNMYFQQSVAGAHHIFQTITSGALTSRFEVTDAGALVSGSLDVGDDSTGGHKITIHSRYDAGAPSLHFRTGHPNNTNVWTLGKIQVFDDGNYNGSMRFYTSTAGYNGAVNAGMTEALEIDSSQNSFFAGDVTITDSSAEIRMRESGDNNYYVALSSYHNAGDTFALYGLKGDYLKHIRTDDSDENTHTLRIGGALKRVDIWSNSVQRVMVNESGNVGIGTASPSQRLHVSGSSVGQAKFHSTGSSGARIYISDSSAESAIMSQNATLIFEPVSGTANASISATKVFLGKNANGHTSTTELGGYGVLDDDGQRYGNYGWLTFNAPTNNFTSGARGWAITNAYLTTNFAILKSSNASSEPYLSTDGVAGTGTTVPFRLDANGEATFGGGVSMPSGNVSVGGKLNVASSVGIGDVGLEKTFSIAFSDGVSHQKAQIQFTKFWGELEISVSGTFANQNNAGVITKKYGLGVQNYATYANESRYTESLGVTANNFAIGEVTWDTTNSRYYIPIVHRVATGNTCTVRVRCLGGDGSQTDYIEGLTVSSVYTTDTTAYDKPEVSFVSPIGIDDSTPPSKLSLSTGLGDGIRIQRSGFESTHYTLYDPDSINAYPSANTNTFSINNDVTSHVGLVSGGGSVGIGTLSPIGLLNLYKSNASAVLTIQRREVDGALTTGDIIGQIDFVTNDDSYNSGNNTTRASIKADIQSSTSASGLIFETGNSSSATAEAMYISPNGSVSVGMPKAQMSKTFHIQSNTGQANTPNGLMLTNTIHGSDSQIYMYAENDSGTSSSGIIKYDPDAMYMWLQGSGGKGLYINHSGHTIFSENAHLLDDNALTLGTSEDAHIWSDGSHTYFRNNIASQDMIFKVRVGSSLVEPLRLDGATGQAHFTYNMGLGTSSPSSPAGVGRFLHIANSSHAGIVLDDTGSTAYDIYSADGHLYAYSEHASKNTLTLSKDGNLNVYGGTGLTQMTVNGAGGESAIRFKDSDGNVDGYVYANTYGVGFLDEGGHWTIKAQNNTGIYFYTNNGSSQHMQILNSGNVGIGTTNDTYKLEVAGTGRFSGHLTASGGFSGKMLEIFTHNFSDDMGTTRHFLPWQGTGEQTTMDDSRVAYATPFSMVFERLVIRPENIDGSSAGQQIEVKVSYQADGSSTETVMGTYTTTGSWADETCKVVNRSDFSANMNAPALSRVMISLKPAQDISGTTNWYCTSVWNVSKSL